MIPTKDAKEILLRRYIFLYKKTEEWELAGHAQGNPHIRHSTRMEIAAIRRALWEMGVSEVDLPPSPPMPVWFKPTNSKAKILDLD